jgi:hypothetical protein
MGAEITHAMGVSRAPNSSKTEERETVRSATASRVANMPARAASYTLVG